MTFFEDRSEELTRDEVRFAIVGTLVAFAAVLLFAFGADLLAAVLP